MRNVERNGDTCQTMALKFIQIATTFNWIEVDEHFLARVNNPKRVRAIISSND